MRQAPPPTEPDAEPFLEERPSKSERKRQMHDLQALGEELSELPEARVEALDLPESLREALREYRRIRSHEGRRRQLQFIGKLMRQTDDGPIREAVAAAKLGSARETLALHEAERWREELLASDEALTRWLAAHPEADAQQLRSLVRAARKDAAQKAGTEAADRRSRAYRDLFQLIKAALAATSSEPATDQAEAQDE